MRISVRELKSHLSSYLLRAQSGESIEVTSHRKVVARLIGVPAAESAGISRMLAEGMAAWAGGKPAGASIRLSTPGRPVSDIVLADRG